MIRDLYRVGPNILRAVYGQRRLVLTNSAGHETSGHTLAWTLDFLAVYPEWQDAVAKEITDLCGDNWPCESLHPFLIYALFFSGSSSFS